MNPTTPAETLNSASELWETLVGLKMIQPETYDQDLAQDIAVQLPPGKPLAQGMQEAKWTPKDLLRSILPTIDSFGSLISDLLNLYDKVDAKEATNGNLQISYEFDENETLDQTLASFRAVACQLEKAKSAAGKFTFPSIYPDLPFDNAGNLDRSEYQKERIKSMANWSIKLPTSNGNITPAIARGISLVRLVLTAYFDKLNNNPEDRSESRENSAEIEDENSVKLFQIIFIAHTDYFPEVVSLQLEKSVSRIWQASPSEQESWLSQIENWYSTFWQPGNDNVAEVLQDILSLPSWGKRHELYSAWAICIFEKAFASQELSFNVVNNTLRFPFKATQIASFKDENGVVEIWSEVRSEAEGMLSPNRVNGVQPDYRLMRPGQDPKEAELAVEIKHYWKPKGAQHGVTAKDYAKALPLAKIFLVAHGPIGKTAINKVDESNRPRTLFCENIRALNSPQTNSLISELRGCFPPPAPSLSVITLVRGSFLEFQTKIMGETGATILLSKNLSAGSVRLSKIENGVINLEIVCHPERSHSIDTSDLEVELTFDDESVRCFSPRYGNITRVWNLGRIANGSFLPSSETWELESS